MAWYNTVWNTLTNPDTSTWGNDPTAKPADFSKSNTPSGNDLATVNLNIPSQQQTPEASSPVAKPAQPANNLVSYSNSVSKPFAVNTQPIQKASNPVAFSQGAFQSAIKSMESKMAENKPLVDLKNKIYTALYDRPLTDDEKKALTPELKNAFETNNRSVIDMNVRMINDQIQGRMNSLDSSVKYLTEGYMNDVNNQLKQKEDAQAMLQNASQQAYAQGVTPAEYIANAYGQGTVDSLKSMGMMPSDIQIPTGTLASQNNNPGNLRFVGQAGATMGAGGFAKFDSPEAGYQALQNQIQLDSSRGMTLSQFINKYAPPRENNTSLYIQQAMQSLGVTENTPLSNIDIKSIAQFMAQKESGTKIAGTGVSDTQQMAQMLVSGEIAPSQLSKRTSNYNQVLAAAKKLDPSFNPIKSENNYSAAKKFVSSQNSSQMIRFRGAADSVLKSMDSLLSISDQLKRSGIPAMNKAELMAYEQLHGNSPEGKLVAQFNTAAAAIQDEMGSVITGGYATTDDALGLSAKMINTNYGTEQLRASVEEARLLLSNRLQAYDDMTPYGTTGSQYSNMSNSDFLSSIN